jgi:hypothetical protein
MIMFDMEEKNNAFKWLLELRAMFYIGGFAIGLEKFG